MPDLFGLNVQSVTVADYDLIGCWQGDLHGAEFVLTLYASSHSLNGIAVQYSGRLLGHHLVAAGAPTVTRGPHACFFERWAYRAVDLETGSMMPWEAAQITCPPTQDEGQYPGYVLGLGPNRYPVASGTELWRQMRGGW